MSVAGQARNTDGFTLAELLIIVALIVLLAAIALPNLLRSQISANEASAVGSMASINRAEVSYQTSNPAIGFTTLEALGSNGASDCNAPDSRHPCLIEDALARATSPAQARSGYWFAGSPAAPDANGAVSAYVAGTAAAVYQKSGVRDFCSQEDGVVRFRDPGVNSAPAKSASECRTMTALQ